MWLLLVVNDLWELESTTVTPPTDATKLAEHKKNDAKARIPILDDVRDHIISHISRKKTTREMWEAEKKLYQSDNEHRKMVLKDKLRAIKISKIDIMVTYLTKITQVHDELSVVR